MKQKCLTALYSRLGNNRLGNKLQYFTVKGILGQDRLSGSANVQNLNLLGLNSMSQVSSHFCS